MADLEEIMQGIDDDVWAIVDAPVTWSDVESDILGGGIILSEDGIMGANLAECVEYQYDTTSQTCCDGVSGLHHEKLLTDLVVTVVGKSDHPDLNMRGVSIAEYVEYLDEYPIEYFDPFMGCFYDVEVSLAEIKTHCDGNDYLHVTTCAKDPKEEKEPVCSDTEHVFGPIDTSQLNKQNALNFGLEMGIAGGSRG